MKKTFVLIGLVILFTILDNSLMPFLSIRGYYASLAFVFCICYSIINGSWEGLWVGALCGLLQDMFFGSAIGINALSTMLICVIAGEFGNNLFKEKVLIPIFSCFLFSLLKGIIVFSILYLVGQYSHIEGVVYIGIYSMVISAIMYKKVYRLCQKSYMIRRWRF